MDGMTTIGRSWVKRGEPGWVRRWRDSLRPAPKGKCPSCACLMAALESTVREYTRLAVELDNTRSLREVPPDVRP